MHTLVEYMASISGSLGKAVDACNRAVGSLETRVPPAARKFKEPGAAGGDELPEREPIERIPHQLDNAGLDAAQA